MDAVSIQLDHILVVAAVCIAVLVLDDDEEWVRGYGIRSAHEAQRYEICTLIGDLGEKRTVLLRGRVGWFGEFL